MLSLVRTILAIALFAAANAAIAEDRASDSRRLLPRAEGIVLADRTLEYPTSTPWPDCSHLVHEVLNDAGLEYPYATSNELYNGIAQFRRVRRPQPGDLIVWRGHVGVVVDPRNHRFFSATESGPRTDNYESDYWRRRGIARFYRYVVNDQTQLVARARRSNPNRISDEPVDPGANDPSDTVTTQPAPEPVIVWRAPESLAIEARGRKPSKEEIERTVSEYLKLSTAALESKNRVENEVVFVRRAQVKKVHVNGDLGWAEIRFESLVQLASDGTPGKKKSEKVRWSLRQNQNRWELILPQVRIYVAEDAAIPTLEQELSAGSTRASTLVAVLNLLIKK